MKKTVGWWRVLTFALAFFSFAGDVRSDIAAGFEAARNCTVTGDVLDSETEVSLEVKAASMRDGARCVYNATASGGAYARKVKLFPGENVVTATTATGTDTKYYSFDAGSWSLRVELSWAGNNQDYDLHVNDVYFGNRNSGGGTLDHDWTHNSSDGNPIENITYSQASAGMYRIYVYYYNDNEYNDEGEQVGSPQATTVRVYVNEQRIHSDSYLITEYNGISTGNGKSIWNVATVVLHAGDGAGGYAVDGRRLDLAEQAGLRGISPRTTFSVTDFSGPNGADPVYLLVGDAARFAASGTLNSGSGNEQTGLEILEKYTSAAGTVGTVDGLGVFVGKAPGQTQISCMGHSGSPVDVYVLKVELAPAETNVCWRTQTEVRRLTSDSYWADGSVDWTVEPSTGLDVTSSDDTSFTFSPTNSAPGAYTVTAASSLLPECKDECVVRIVKVDIDPAETNVCWRTQSATLSLTADSRPGGSVDWTVESSTGLDVMSSDDTSFTFSPTNSTPGAYTVTAASSLLPECKDECVVRIVKVDIDPAETNVCWRMQGATLTLTAGSRPGGSVDWTVEPSTGLDVTSSDDTSFTFSPTNSTPGEYTVTAASSFLPECKDECVVRVLKIGFNTNELIRPLHEQTLDAETWLTDDTFDKTRITWSITKVEGVDATIDQDGDITYGQGAGIYTVRAESSDLSTCYDEFTLMVLDWVLGAHSNAGDGAPFISGHAWISVTDFSQNPVPVATFGLWPDDHPLIIQDGLNNGDGTDVRVGREPAYGLHNRYFFLNPTEKQSLVNYINVVRHWTYWYTCASFAEGSVMTATGEDVDADDYLGFETPREFGSSINQLEATDPTDRINPVNGGNVNSSWVPSSFEGSVHDP